MSATTLKSIQHRIAVGAYNFNDSGALVRTHRTEVDLIGEKTELSEFVGIPAPAMLLANERYGSEHA